MVRLTRAQQQARTRAAVLAAAREEFLDLGYPLAKIDRIAERAELTRGAVYSNFPSKRALYLAVLLESIVTRERPQPPRSAGSLDESTAAFARVWLERLPLVQDTAAGGRLQLRSLVGVVDDQAGRTVLAQTARLEALLLAIGLECCAPDHGGRRVRLAELVLTLLSGAGVLAELAPGFGDPFDRISACRQLAGLDLHDSWSPTYLPFVEPAVSCRDTWTAPTAPVDVITGNRVDVGANGLIAVLGANRLSAAEEAVRCARSGDQVTIVAAAVDADAAGLIRLRIADLVGCLCQVFPDRAWKGLHLVIDDVAPVVSAIGLSDLDDDIQAAVQVRDGLIVARAAGRGAAYAAATVDAQGSTRRGDGS